MSQATKTKPPSVMDLLERAGQTKTIPIEPPTLGLVETTRPGAPVTHKLGEVEKPKIDLPPPVELNTGTNKADIWAGQKSAPGWELVQRIDTDFHTAKAVYAMQFPGGVLVNISARGRLNIGWTVAEAATFIPGITVADLRAGVAK